jgi:hypothetical protein
MSLLWAVSVFATVPIASVGLLELQARLEQWDQRRHAQD